MARKQHHEDHVNHEAWAIPYGDLITLLLAFFVVMYAVSSVNEGKYRVLSDSLMSAFRGAPRSLSPVQVGDQVMRAPEEGSRAGMDPMQAQTLKNDPAPGAGGPSNAAAMLSVARQLELAMGELISAGLVAVNRNGSWVEVEIKTDILFPSGSAEIDADALGILSDLGEVLVPLANVIRVEGHTDDRPISTPVFPSNWELSAARAARIVREFEGLGIAAGRMIVAGMGEHHPIADNGVPEGRTRNRRVALIVLDPGPEGAADERGVVTDAAAPEPVPEPGVPPAQVAAEPGR